MQKEAFEPTGLIPRSIIRTFDRFLQQLLPGSESVAIQEYRVSRYQILVSIQSLFILVFIPFFVNYVVKSFVVMPLTEHFWNLEQKEIFLNAYQEKRAFAEMQDFSEKIFFESLLRDTRMLHPNTQNVSSKRLSQSVDAPTSAFFTFDKTSVESLRSKQKEFSTISLSDEKYSSQMKTLNEEFNLQKMFQAKSLQIADRYNKQSILAITNICADLISLCSLYLLSMLMKAQIIILKSFLIESIYSLSDTTKSFLLILIMDLLVGFHSPRAWEIGLETFFQRFGFPENENFILLFVALFPVFLDTVFKYWIFRYLNKISPSTVVTYHSMIE